MRKHKTKTGKRAGNWFVLGESLIGGIEWNLVPKRDTFLEPIYTIFAFISLYAVLGSRAVRRYGSVRALCINPDHAWIQELKGQSTKRNSTLPDFRDFFFACFRIKPTNNSKRWQAINGIRQAAEGKPVDFPSLRPRKLSKRGLEQVFNHGKIPIASAIGNWLRYQWAHQLNPVETQCIIGGVQEVCLHCYQHGLKKDPENSQKNWCPRCKKIPSKNQAIHITSSKIYISYAYCQGYGLWEFRIWGWLTCAEFEHLYLRSHITTALNMATTSAEESLHEVEFIVSHREGVGRTQIGGLVFHDGITKSVLGDEKKWRAYLGDLQIGGERSYGFGRIRFFRVQNYKSSSDNYRLDGECPVVEIKQSDPILAHSLTNGFRGKGDIEPSVGGQTDTKRSDAFVCELAKATI